MPFDEFDEFDTNDNWDDTAGGDDALLDSWDVDLDELEAKKKAEEEEKEAKKAELKRKQEEQKLKKKGLLKGNQTLAELDELDEDTRKELLRQAELLADLNNAADLFGGLGVAEDINAHPRDRITKDQIAAAQLKRSRALTRDTPLEEHPLFLPLNKAEFEKLRKTLTATLVQMHEDQPTLYALLLAIDLIRDIAAPLNVEQTRKLTLTLNVQLKEKERAERQARLKKTGGTATGGAGKKKAKPAAMPNVGSFKKDDYDDFDDGDFGDDDFM